jgi:formylglycine-generating enzyme required for sulfatase activity
MRAAVVVLVAAVAVACGRNPPADAGNGSSSPVPAGAAPRTIRSASGVDMVVIPGGWFEMGRADGRDDERPVHRVWIDTFVLDAYEVTQEEYARLQLSDPSRFKGPRLPAERQTWIDAVRLCSERSLAERLEPPCDDSTLECRFDANGYRLPTEAEWEYASRAGATTRYAWGDDLRQMSQHAWIAENGGGRTHDVGTRRPNAWGLFDMPGNVAEWVHDYYGERYYASSPERNPRGPAAGEYRVIRGGSWNSAADALGPARRAYSASVDDGCVVSPTVGFRCARRPLPGEAK